MNDPGRFQPSPGHDAIDETHGLPPVEHEQTDDRADHVDQRHGQGRNFGVGDRRGDQGHDVQDGEVEFVQTSTKLHTFQSEFSLDTLEELPKVEILTNYGGIDPAILEGILATKPECIILAGMGHGILPTPIRERATKAYPIMVRASRVGTGKVSPLHSMGSFLYGGTLSAPKLRILLSLALTKTKEKLVLQDYINRY